MLARVQACLYISLYICLQNTLSGTFIHTMFASGGNLYSSTMTSQLQVKGMVNQWCDTIKKYRELLGSTNQADIVQASM